MKVDFFKIWSPDMAWVLGYIWADGSVVTSNLNKLNLQCIEEDRELIDRIYTLLDCHQKILRLPPKEMIGYGGKRYMCKSKVNLHIGSKEMIKDLVGLGVVPNKSALNLAMPDVPIEMLSHFVRGYLDGDGSVYVKENDSGSKSVQVFFYGGKRFMRDLRDKLVDLLDLRRNGVILSGKSGLRKVVWSSRRDVKILYKWLYPNEKVPCLNRKRLKMGVI